MDTTGEVDRILADAAEKAGLDDFGETWFLGPLSAYAADLEQPNLTEFGRRFLRSRAVLDLVRRLRVLETLRQHPEIAAVPIPPIVYITGLERSGTTLLHNLLALHRDARVLRRWELLEPVPPPETATYDTDARIARVQGQTDMLRGTLLEHMHWVNATDPEECVCGFIDSVSMLAWAAGPCMPTWWRFLTEADLCPAFENYRRVVQLLLWKHPVEPGGFLVLKAPQISRQVAQFAEVFPEARFVITDRDPYRCIVSLAVLGHAIVEWFCETNPLTDDGHRSKISSRPGAQQAGGHRRLHDGCTVHARCTSRTRSSCALPSTSSNRRWKRTPPTTSCPPRWSRTSNGSRRANGPRPRQPSIRWATTRRACGVTRSSGRTANGSASNPSGPA